ncbi:ena/VASP-like protein [Poeciliopsis prolifica]|uniref:ena/VASP-like protein n=1 Tax=Poeciliopsis prolifica TaxID=188132 RepID=UPI00241425FC|nr:ena/VASP-like protein [Poeciliopsis prolifica]
MRSMGGPSSEEAPPPFFSITSRRVQDEFLKERQRRLESQSDASSPLSSSPSSSCSPLPSPSPQAPPPASPYSPPRQPDSSPGLSLSSPELLSELTRRDMSSETRPEAQRTDHRLLRTRTTGLWLLPLG